MRDSFTIIELVFVIVMLGILASIALPKFAAMHEEALISKAQSKVTAIRSALQVYKNRHILLGQQPYPNSLTSSKLFDVILPPGEESGTKAGEWEKVGTEKYRFHLDGDHYITFSYDKTKGTFTCDTQDSNPSDLCNAF